MLKIILDNCHLVGKIQWKNTATKYFQSNFYPSVCDLYEAYIYLDSTKSHFVPRIFQRVIYSQLSRECSCFLMESKHIVYLTVGSTRTACLRGVHLLVREQVRAAYGAGHAPHIKGWAPLKLGLANHE